MDAFTFHNPTKIVFGKDCVAQLEQDLAKYGQKRAVNLWRWQY